MKSRIFHFSVILVMAATMAAAQQTSQIPGAMSGSGSEADSCTPDMQSAGLCTVPSQAQNILVPSGSGQSGAAGVGGQIPGYINPLSTPYGQGIGAELQQNGLQSYGYANRQPNLNQQNAYSASSQPNKIPLPPEPLTDFQKFVASTTQQVLPIFGVSLFQNVPSTFAPLNQGPVPDSYILGPGDQIHVQVWGQVNFATTLPIDRTGGIYLPQVGEVHLAGIPVSSLETVLRQAVGRVFRNFQLTASLGQLRSIQV